MIPIDALIAGGGLQGLVLLDVLAAAGRSCVLVTHSEMGQGQTLHAHGLLNTGFGFAGPELRETRDRLVLPFLRARGIEPYGEWFLLAPDEMQVGETASADSLPAGFDTGGAHVWRLHELNFPRRRLVESLVHDHLGRLFFGRVTGVKGTGAIDTVQIRLSASGEELLFAPAVVVAATGTGTKRFVGSLADATVQLAKIRHRRVHILCVKGPTGAMPATSVLSLAHGLNVVAHTDGRTVVWYSTPFQDDDPSFETAPDDAEADSDPDVVAVGLLRLERLFPAIATRRELRFTAYAGYRQDIGETGGTPACELVGGIANLVMALSKVRRPDIPSGGAGVRVARLREDRPDVRWKTWRQMIS